MMKKLLKNFVLAAVAVASIASCSENQVGDNITPNGNQVTLYATTPSEETTPSTKIDFVDFGYKINLTWSAGDTFNLYAEDGKTLIGKFTTETEDGKFTSPQLTTELVEGTNYIAKYNENADLSAQNGDNINNLDDACQMEATFTYSANTPIAFKHTKAIMTLKFKCKETPERVVFMNGEQSYTVNYSAIQGVNDIYTSHIMIDPCDATPRTLFFEIYVAGSDKAIGIRSVESSKEYKKGYRYTSDLESFPFWTDYADDSFVEGPYTEGTTAYTIATAEQFAYLAKLVNAGETMKDVTFTLVDNIDLAGHEWVAVGNKTYKFQGTFDGAEHEVSNILIKQRYKEYQALFGYIERATIKNLSATGNVSGTNRIGGIVGQASLFSTVKNCSSSITVTLNYFGGGVVGCAENSNIIDCRCTGYVESKLSSAGGISGSNSYCHIINCHNSATVKAKGSAGGIVGISSNKTNSIVNCYNEGEVINIVTTNSNYPGGIVGSTFATDVNNCYNVGEITSSYSIYGGIAGLAKSSDSYNRTTIKNCYWENSTAIDGYRTEDEYTKFEDSYSKSESEMKTTDFLALLNANAAAYNSTIDSDDPKACSWAMSDGYPTLVFGTIAE